jgi:hypothetical protein
LYRPRHRRHSIRHRTSEAGYQDERFCRMRCAKILMLRWLRRAEAYPEVLRASAQVC